MNGVLLDKEKIFLIPYLQIINEIYKLPNGVLKIGDVVFSGCAELASMAELKSD